MKYARSIVAAAVVAIPVAPFAQGFVGAELSAELAAMPENHSLGVTSYGGGLEFGLFSGLSVELDLAANDWRGFRGRSSTMTLHGIYEIMPDTSVGLYWSRERVSDQTANAYGIEGTMSFGALDLAGHLGHYEADSVSGDLFGINATYSFGYAFALTGGLKSVSGAEDFTVTSLGGEYRFDSGPIVFAGVDHESSDTDSDTYLSIGARIELGQGTTFGSRGISDGRPVF